MNVTMRLLFMVISVGVYDCCGMEKNYRKASTPIECVNCHRSTCDVIVLECKHCLCKSCFMMLRQIYGAVCPTCGQLLPSELDMPPYVPKLQ